MHIAEFLNPRGGQLGMWPRVAPIGVLLLFVSFMSPRLFSQDNNSKKVKPSSTATIKIQEIERREKETPAAEKEKKKKVENENLKYPRKLPVPRGAKGKTFKVKPPENKNIGPNPPVKKTTPSSSLEPQFPAIGDNNTTIPPDVGGAVGPNHVMTTLNSQVRIQDKSGTVISTVTLDGFFSPLVGAAAVFDPKIIYDPFGARWIMTAPANSFSPTSSLLIAVSSTSDPTGAWTGYSFAVDSTGANWFDYPSIGFNKNWIVITGNLFPVAGGTFVNEQVYIFDKAALYGGAAAPVVLNRPAAEGAVMCPAITLDNSMNTEYLLSDWNGSSGGNGFLRVFTITGTPAAPVFAATMLFPNVSQPWADFPNATGADFAPQNTVSQKIQNNDSRMQDVVFQNGSLWAAHTVFLPAATPTHSAAQWWQIDPTTATVQQFGRVEDSSAANFFAFTSIAVNAYNDLLLGFASFSATQFASADYAFRLHSDTLSTLRPSVEFKAGVAKYFKTFGAVPPQNRWGDYSTTALDPDGFSLWTVQEYAEAPVAGTDRWGTEWNRLVPPVASLYLKDRPEDLGAEPDPSTMPMWQSEDIWLRQLQDPTHASAHLTQNAEYRTGTSNPNYVYVEVHNRGAAPSAGTEQLTLYWAKASSGLSWPSPWTGGVFFDPPANTILMGDVIGTVTMPVIAPGASTILEFPWNPPDPATYVVFGADQNHFCLLARVTTSGTAPFGMTFLEATDLYANVQNNNHIAWKNIEVLNLLPGTQAPAFAVIANLGNQKMNVKLKFAAVDANGDPVLLDQGILKVTAGGRLKDILKERRPLGDEGFKDTGDGTFQIVKEGGVVRNIVLEPKDYGTLEIVFVPNNARENMAGYAVTITQLEELNGTDRIVGGQTAVFGTVKGFGVSPGGGTVAAHWPWWYWLLLVIVILVLLLLLWHWKK